MCAEVGLGVDDDKRDVVILGISDNAVVQLREATVVTHDKTVKEVQAMITAIGLS